MQVQVDAMLLEEMEQVMKGTRSLGKRMESEVGSRLASTRTLICGGPSIRI